MFGVDNYGAFPDEYIGSKESEMYGKTSLWNCGSYVLSLRQTFLIDGDIRVRAGRYNVK